ncbi:MAG: VOC family protein [Proteobacteria bacterium]|nr:VOC family protein [Pseudomonadota bacterium]
MIVHPYLNFDGRCEQAVRFYERALGATVEMLVRHRESPEPAPPGALPPDSGDKIMHAALRIGDTVVMATDGYCRGGTAFGGFNLSLAVADGAEAGRVFAALADGGQVDMPLARTFFSPCFGMVTDRFGVHWMVNVQS